MNLIENLKKIKQAFSFSYQAQYQMLQQQQAAHYDMDPRTTNFQPFDYTLIQPHSLVKKLFFKLY